MNAKKSMLENAQKLEKTQLKTIRGGAADCDRYLCFVLGMKEDGSIGQIVTEISAAEIPACQAKKGYRGHVSIC
ncbi:hypothetical protein [Chryseobacterium sp.]|uniref:hypothetical protein n=1 Tax=Chryseobacterium sp. TaxID=1871047 RepID=UPI00321B68CA